MRFRFASLILLFVFAALAWSTAAQDSAHVIKYEPTYATVKFAFGPGEPVARLAPGDTLETDTLNCVRDCAGIPPDKLEFAKNSNLLTGPFYVEGAQPGDTLAIEFLEMHPNGDGEGEIAPGFGAINSSNYTPMLNPDLPRRGWTYPIDRATDTATFTAHDGGFSVKIPLHPFLGCVGVAPALGETRDSLVPAESAATWTPRNPASVTRFTFP